jgi:sulfite reductase (NADPH) flavoprotein alpha-component
LATPSGLYREGLCTKYIETKSLDPTKPVDHLACMMSPAAIQIPDTQRPPYIMVALGTGIAPMRAMLQEREMARKAGETVGEMALFFGARYKATDYTYGEEFEDYHASGLLNVLSTAFSRDQAHKIYVQNRISEVPEIIYDYLIKKNGYFYLCGPAGNVPPAVRKAVCESLVKCGGHSAEEADHMITQLQIDGRYNVEAW